MGAFEWGAVSAIVTIMITIGGVVVRLTTRLNTAEGLAGTAAVSVAATRLEVDRIKTDFSEYQVKAALMFITDKDLNHSEQRISASVNEIKIDIRGVNERLDRVLETRKSPNT